MAYGNPNSEDDYFNDGPKSDMKSDGDGMEQEGLLPKSLMAGKRFDVGDEIILRITHIGERDFSVEYSHGDDKDKEKSGTNSENDKSSAMAGGGSGDEMMY